MIHSLKLTNFRKHANLAVDFTAGLNGIFGPNYTGKTTILYGVLFCLGGISSVPCKSVYKSGTSTFLAEMKFDILGKTYVVSRTKSSAKLFEVKDGKWGDDDTMIANSTSVVNKQIEKLLGMTMKRFCQIRYSRQKFTSALLTLGAAELHNILSDVSGADFVQKVLDRLDKMRIGLDGELKGRVEIDAAGLEATLQQLTGDLWTKEKDVEAAEIAKTLAAATMKAKVEAADNLHAGRASYVAYIARLSSLSETLKKQTTKVDEASKELVELPPEFLPEGLAALRKQLAEGTETLAAIVKLEADHAKLGDRVSMAEKKLGAAKAGHEAAMAALQGPEPVLPPELAGLEAEVNSLRDEVRALQVKAKDKIDAIESGVCRTCLRPLDEHFDPEAEEVALAALQEELEVKVALGLQKTDLLRTSTGIYDKAKKAWDEASRGLKSAELAWMSANEDYEEATAALAALSKVETDSATVRAANESFKDGIRKAESDMERRRRAVERLADATAELDETSKAITSLAKVDEVSDEVLAAGVLEREAATVEASKAAETHRQLVSQLSDLKADIRRVELDIGVAKATNEQIGKLATRMLSIKALQKFLKESKDEYMRDVWNVLMADATSLVIGASSGAIEGLERTEDGQFSYTEDGNTYNVSEASGAQAAIMGLAVQTALARALPPVLDVLLIDEPTADMDEEHSMTFSLLLPSRAAQVICVSHSRMDSSTCTNVIDLSA